jgi:hypothetical protein
MNVARHPWHFLAWKCAESGWRDRKALQPKICAGRKNTLVIINTHFLSKYPCSDAAKNAEGGERGYKGLITQMSPFNQIFCAFHRHGRTLWAHFANRTRAALASCTHRQGVCAHEPVSTHSSMLSGHRACQNSRLMKANEVLCAWNSEERE